MDRKRIDWEPVKTDGELVVEEATYQGCNVSRYTRYFLGVPSRSYAWKDKRFFTELGLMEYIEDRILP